jgi:uncharacterized protein YbjT (DUF2867 family)
MASNLGLVAVTGSTGALGGRVAARLADTGATQRLIVRDPARAPVLAGAEVATAAGYHDRDQIAAALRGAHTLFLVSASPTRADEHLTAVDAAVDAGVRRIVYTSFIGASPDAVFTLARDHYATEEHIRQTGLAYTFLRDSIYMDFVPSFASPEGVIAGPAGEGKCAWVARDDIADVAVAVLTQEGHDGQTYDLTGPESRTLEWAAEILSDHLGREITYEDESIDEAWESRAHHGASDWEVEGRISSYVAVAEGELDVLTDAVPALTGHEAMSLPEFLEANPESIAHLE